MLSVNTFSVVTPAAYTHNYTWLTTHRNVFEFSARACSEVRVALADVAGTLGAGAYEVIIGGQGNTKTTIVKDMQSNEIGQEVDSQNVLDCQQFKVCATKERFNSLIS